MLDQNKKRSKNGQSANMYKMHKSVERNIKRGSTKAGLVTKRNGIKREQLRVGGGGDRDDQQI